MQGGEYLDLQGSKLENFPGIDVDKLQEAARIMRGFMFCALEAVHSGHPGGSSGKTEQFLAMVLGGQMAFDPLDPKNNGRDRVVWSAGHCSPGLYGGLSFIYESLRRAGIKFDAKAIDAVMPENLLRFRHPDGPQGHIESHYPLADLGTGASGHGLSAAGGIAIAHRSSGLDTKVFVFMGDAETEEGMSYEARNVLNTMGIDNLIVSLDYNHFGIDGNINEVIASPYINHWLGLGWNVIEVDGHNFLELITAYQKAREGFSNDSPTVVLAHCIKGKCYGAKENTADSHGSPAKSEEYLEIMKKMGFDVTGKVEEDVKIVSEAITPELAKYIAERLEVAKTKIKTEAENVELMKKSLGERPLLNPIEIKRPGELPAELKFAEGTNVATRKATQAWFEWMMKQTAFFWAGTGDLSKSILMDKAEKAHGLITRENKYGRGIRFGIAEQNMAMLSCGMTQDRLPGGFAPVSAFSSYGVFTSMMSNAVRMTLIGNALDPKRKGFFIMLAAHDGPETGEDGATHQGLFWMSLYTAYPGIKVYKPMDANETIEMLFYALEKGEPIALSVARPDTMVFKRENGVPPASEAVNGAYIFYQSQKSVETQNFASVQRVVLAVCGGQTLINTMEAVPELEKQGLSVKVIAVTSPELFEDLRKNNPKKAEEIFSDEDREHAIAIHNGWKGFLYPFLLPKDYTDRTIAIDHFLKSGSPKEVYELAGLTAGDIIKKILH